MFAAGACYAIFSPAFNLSTNDQWHKLPEGVDHLVIYTAFFYFSLAFFACAIIINVCFLYKPAFGVPKSSLGAYFKDWNGRWIALLAGVLCGWGNGFQFMGGQAAGYAAADAVQVQYHVTCFDAVLYVTIPCTTLHDTAATYGMQHEDLLQDEYLLFNA